MQVSAPRKDETPKATGVREQGIKETVRAWGGGGTGLGFFSSNRPPRTPGRRGTLTTWRSEKLGQEAAARTER